MEQLHGEQILDEVVKTALSAELRRQMAPAGEPGHERRPDWCHMVGFAAPSPNAGAYLPGNAWTHQSSRYWGLGFWNNLNYETACWQRFDNCRLNVSTRSCRFDDVVGGVNCAAGGVQGRKSAHDNSSDAALAVSRLQLLIVCRRLRRCAA